MLPDYTVVKEKYSQYMNYSMRFAATQGLIDALNIGLRNTPEGDIFTVQHGDGTTESNPFFTAESQMEIPIDEYNNMSQADVDDRFAEAFQDIISQRDRHIIQNLDDIVENAGNVINMEGDPDKLIDGLSDSGMEFDFSDGDPRFTILVHPSSKERAEKLWHQIETEPRLKKKWDNLLDLKRREWHDREALRKLVG